MGRGLWSARQTEALLLLRPALSCPSLCQAGQMCAMLLLLLCNAAPAGWVLPGGPGRQGCARGGGVGPGARESRLDATPSGEAGREQLERVHGVVRRTAAARTQAGKAGR